MFCDHPDREDQKAAVDGRTFQIKAAVCCRTFVLSARILATPPTRK
jgi:hypothetical protein